MLEVSMVLKVSLYTPDSELILSSFKHCVSACSGLAHQGVGFTADHYSTEVSHVPSDFASNAVVFTVLACYVKCRTARNAMFYAATSF